MAAEEVRLGANDDVTMLYAHINQRKVAEVAGKDRMSFVCEIQPE